VIRYFYSLLYIKPIQFYYLLIYRFLRKSAFTIGDYRYSLYKLNFRLNYSDSSFYSNSSVRGREFRFLNLTHVFESDIHWEYTGKGKLWNYNLQYLALILDERVNLKDRRDLLLSNSMALLQGTLRLEAYPTSMRINNILIFHSLYEIDCADVERALFLQIEFLKRNLEYHLQANHLLENYISLFVASYATRDVKLNKQMSLRLSLELEEQFFGDGAHFERSPMYHSIILYRLFFCIDIIENNPVFENSVLLLKLKNVCAKMVCWLDNISYRNGTWPLLNDSTNEVSLPKFYLDKLAHILDLPRMQLELGDSGYRKFELPSYEVLMNVGNISPAYQPGPSHSDMLSFCLSDGSKELIVDTGISTYESSERRRYERGTIAHNTITSDGNNQSDVWSSFRVGKRAKLILTIDKENHIEAIVRNLLSTNVLVNHKRSFQIINSRLEIRDAFNSDCGVLLNSIHFDYKVIPKVESGSVYFDNFVLEYESGMKFIELREYEQSIGFNVSVKALKLIAGVEKTSSFVIYRI